MNDNPYMQTGKSPKMLPSFVCHVDILGYAQLSKAAINSGQGQQFLMRLREALSNAYDRVRERARSVIFDESRFALKVFTDNIVIGYPIDDPPINKGEPELGDVFDVLASFQAGLAQEGFLTRGGIAFGEHYMDNDIVFGDAFLQATSLDRAGGAPRIALASSALELVQQHLSFYGRIEHSPHYHYLLKDADGTIFLNYLGQAFAAFPDYGIFFELIEGHWRHIREGLREYRAKPDVRAKYEWSARYHNFICKEFAEQHPIPCHPDADEFYGAAAAEAQKLKNYIVDVGLFAAEPSRMETL